MSSPLKNRPALTSRDSESNIVSRKDEQKANFNKSSPFSRSRSFGNVQSEKSGSIRGGFGYSRKNSKPHPPSKLGFQIFEDKTDYRQAMLDELNIKESGLDQENFGNDHKAGKSEESCQDQENVLRFLKRSTARKSLSTAREPLAPLNANEFPGFISTSSNSRKIQLKEEYIPANFNNEQRSLHKFINIPSYVTPVRSRKDYLCNKFLVKSNDYDEDDVEAHLNEKSRKIARKRSYSVGKNSMKSGLISKNKFAILSI